MEHAFHSLTRHHAANCPAYRTILSARGINPDDRHSLEDVPFLPVRLFKEKELRSIEQDKIVKVLTSSGTTSQQVSRIYLDRETSMLQTRALVLILQSLIGATRLPMLIIDHPGLIKDRRSYSARAAGVLGLSNFGRLHTYALNDGDMSLNLAAVREFAANHGNEKVLLFGFTFMIWKYFIQRLAEEEKSVNLKNAVMLHSGGWKKLQDEAVDQSTFKTKVHETIGTQAIHNFYGMVEQVGSVFMECEHGHLHTPAFADILIRNPYDWSVCAHGDPGVVQVLSLLPRSYPGHSLLTEDLGVVLGEDDCRCGRKGKYFRIDGRISQAELRGCSDTHAASI